MPSASFDKNKAVLKGPGHRLTFEMATGRFQIHGSGSLKPALSDLSFGLSTAEGYHGSESYTVRKASKVPVPEWLGKGSGLEFTCQGASQAPQISLQAFAVEGRPQLFLKFAVKNTTAKKLDLKEMDLLKLVLPERPNL